MQDVNGHPAADSQAKHRRPPPSDGAVAADPGRWSYAAQALGLVFYVLTIWLEVYLDTRKATAGGTDAFQESHRRWRLRSSLLFFTWTILGGLTLPFGFGLPVLLLAWLWFAARIMIGWFYWERGRAIGQRRPARRSGAHQHLGRTLPTQLSEQS